MNGSASPPIAAKPNWASSDKIYGRFFSVRHCLCGEALHGSLEPKRGGLRRIDLANEELVLGPLFAIDMRQLRDALF